MIVANGQRMILLTFLRMIPLEVRLFKNNIDPTKLDTSGLYEEADFHGYKSIPLDYSKWQLDNDFLEASHTQVTFLSYAEQEQPQDIYGYYITRKDKEELIIAKKFSDGPYPIVQEDDKIKIIPKLSW